MQSIPAVPEKSCWILEWLDRRVACHLTLIEESAAYRAIESERTSIKFTMSIIREILLEVFSYGPLVALLKPSTQPLRGA